MTSQPQSGAGLSNMNQYPDPSAAFPTLFPYPKPTSILGVKEALLHQESKERIVSTASLYKMISTL